VKKKDNNPKKPHKRKRPQKPIRKIKYNSDGKYAKMEFQICIIAKPKKRICGKKTELFSHITLGAHGGVRNIGRTQGGRVVKSTIGTNKSVEKCEN
jgi:hypothetical protein